MSGTLVDLLAKTVSSHPGRTAVVDPRAGKSLTYAELSARAGEWRDALARLGISVGDRVGLYAPKSIDAVSAIHGVLAAGAAYVPADALAPAPRSAGIFADCEVAAIIVGESSIDRLRSAMMPARLEVRERIGDLALATAGERKSSTGTDTAAASDLAYILYTSGSTGKPKGVMHTHSSALSFIDWCSRTLEPAEADRFSSHAPFHFDLSILDLFVSAKHGSAVVLIDEDSGKQPLKLAALIGEQRLSIWYSTPSTLRLLTGFGKLDRNDLSALRLVLFAGEVYPVPRLRELIDALPGRRYLNLYGPTETNVCTWHEVNPDSDIHLEALPIGHVTGNNRARVEDGELCIAGETVMSGYWNMPERTADAFLVDDDGQKWYRTGDVVRESGGGFVFAGRRDRMVKRRGFRVELAEIEAALSRHPEIRDAVVAALPDDESGVRLEAALVSGSDSRPSIIELKQFCAGNLPMYMVPDRFRYLDAIPQTSTGKVDYQRLQEELT